jgi:capsular polysaccharide biosynthesis protein
MAYEPQMSVLISEIAAVLGAEDMIATVNEMSPKEKESMGIGDDPAADIFAKAERLANAIVTFFAERSQEIMTVTTFINVDGEEETKEWEPSVYVDDPTYVPGE